MYCNIYNNDKKSDELSVELNGANRVWVGEQRRLNYISNFVHKDSIMKDSIFIKVF